MQLLYFYSRNFVLIVFVIYYYVRKNCYQVMHYLIFSKINKTKENAISWHETYAIDEREISAQVEDNKDFS